ncbi:hypothetical protein NHQ30_005634 [Ciborinia camelliae]|nr:hypothetical protein NHQ30_005634 [Ciborinia camelliae]
MPGKVVDQAEWLEARRELLAREKALLHAQDALNKTLRNFPMTKVTENYTFTSTTGPIKLSSLFHDRKQLIVYHFMLSPTSKAGCPGCCFLTDNLPSSLTHLNSRDTTLVLVSRAPIDKIEDFKKRMGWNYEWVSSFETEFNHDFGVTIQQDGDEYNYKKRKVLKEDDKGEEPGLSVFWNDGDEIFHTYSTYARGLDGLLGTYRLLDMTPLGRQDDIIGGWKLHDEYEDAKNRAELKSKWSQLGLAEVSKVIIRPRLPFLFHGLSNSLQKTGTINALVILSLVPETVHSNFMREKYYKDHANYKGYSYEGVGFLFKRWPGGEVAKRMSSD